MSLHLISFLLNLACFIAVGGFVGHYAHALKKNRKNKIRFYFITTSAALIGGLLAELANGSPEFGIAFMNIFIALFAAILSVLFAFPSYFSLLTKKSRRKKINLKLHIFRSK